MKVYPAIDIQHGRSVQLVGGDPAQVAVEGVAPDAQARAWKSKGARRVHVVDLDAALGGSAQWQHVHRIVATGMAVQFGGGVRSMTQIQQLLDMGVRHVVVGTQGAKHPYWARELGQVFPGRVVQAVDARDRHVAIEGWQQDSGVDAVALAKDLDNAGLAAMLYTDIGREGRLEGIDTRLAEELRSALEATPLIVAGGITSDADLDALAALDVDGVVLGMSLHAGRIDLEAAIKKHEAVEVTT